MKPTSSPPNEPAEDLASTVGPIRDSYHDFAMTHAYGVSPIYQAWALGVADDPRLLDWLAALPAPQRQPNLLFAAVRKIAGTPPTFAQFRQALADREQIEAVMASHRTQTNEPARCAALYPILASLPQPLALIEVGASAGLCLIPDRYRYNYDGAIAGDPDSGLEIACHLTPANVDVAAGPASAKAGWLPSRRIEVAWRAGIDLNPLSVNDPDDMQWLELLIWPGQEDRVARHREAVALARRDPPRIHPGDLNELLPQVAAQAPNGATLVVYHGAVLTYLSTTDRRRFARQVGDLGAHWISQEAPSVLPWIPVPTSHPADTASATNPGRMFLMTLDGQHVAWTAPHGGQVNWLTPLTNPLLGA